MDTNVKEKIKQIDSEISNALSTICQLEEKLSTVRTDEEGYVLRDECIILKEKFASFNKSLNELTKMLQELGILDNEDI